MHGPTWPRRRPTPRSAAMSGPNTPYDPVEVTPWTPRARRRRPRPRWPPSRPRPTSTRSRRPGSPTPGTAAPLALANREIGGAAADRQGRRRQAGRRRPAAGSTQALAARQAELEAERDARVLVEESVDVTLPCDRRPRGARHPLRAHRPERIADVFVAHGLGGRRGPRGRGRVVQLRRAELRPGPPGPPDAGHVLRRPAPTPAWCCAPTPRRCRSARCSSASRRSTSSAPARCSAPTSSTPRTRPVFHQVEGLAVDEGLTMAHLKGTLDHFAPSDVRRGHRAPGCARRTSRSPSRQRRDGPACFVCRGARRPGPALPHLRRHRLDRVGRLRHGQPARCCAPAASTPSATPASRSAWASSATLMLRHGVAGHARHGRGRRAVLPRSSGWRSDARVPLSWLRELRRPPRGR